MAAPHRPPPEPLRTDDLRVLVAGTALWAGALAILLLRGFMTGDLPTRWAWACVAGLLLGGVGIRMIRRRQRAEPADHDRPQAPAPP